MTDDATWKRAVPRCPVPCIADDLERGARVDPPEQQIHFELEAGSDRAKLLFSRLAHDLEHRLAVLLVDEIDDRPQITYREANVLEPDRVDRQVPQGVAHGQRVRDGDVVASQHEDKAAHRECRVGARPSASEQASSYAARRLSCEATPCHAMSNAVP